jgi:hypothetical protein
MKAYGEVDVQLLVFLTWVLGGGNWSIPFSIFLRENASHLHSIGGWVIRSCLTHPQFMFCRVRDQMSQETGKKKKIIFTIFNFLNR